MTRISRLGLCSVVVGALAFTGSAAKAQTPTSDDSTSAARGEEVFKKKGCNACHNVAKAGEDPHRRPGGKQAGPDLAGVTERRDRDWLRRWLKDPDPMLDKDPIAKGMLKEAKNLRMPNMRLTDTEIEALLNYLGQKQ